MTMKHITDCVGYGHISMTPGTDPTGCALFQMCSESVTINAEQAHKIVDALLSVYPFERKCTHTESGRQIMYKDASNVRHYGVSYTDRSRFWTVCGMDFSKEYAYTIAQDGQHADCPICITIWNMRR